MQRGAVDERVIGAFVRRLHAIDAEVAPLRLAALDGGREPHERAEHQQRRHELARRPPELCQQHDDEQGDDDGRGPPFADIEAQLGDGPGQPIDRQDAGGGDQPQHQRVLLVLLGHLASAPSIGHGHDAGSESGDAGRDPAQRRNVEDARAARHGERQQQRILEHLAEDLGRDQRRRQAAERSPERHPQIELREVADRGPRLVERAMGHHGRGEEHGNASRRREEPGLVLGLRQRQQGDGHGGEMEVQQHGAWDERLVAEHQHEGEQVERERQHPQQRRGGDVGGDVGGEGREQGRWDQSQADPAQAIRPRRRSSIGLGGVGDRGSHGLAPQLALAGSHDDEDQRQCHDQQQEAQCPQTAELSKPEPRLQDEGIAQQRDQAAQVARRIQEIGIVPVRMPGAGEPGLQEGSVGRHREERQADRHGEEPDLPQIGLARRRLTPAGRQTDGQRDERQQADAQMDQARLRHGRTGDQEVRIAIADQQRRLEEEDGDGPHRG